MAEKKEEKHKGAWFWLGVILLSISGGWWGIVISMIISEGNGEGVLSGVIFTAIPIAIGFYGIRRGRYPDKPWEWFAWSVLGLLYMFTYVGGALFGLIVAMQTFSLPNWVLILGFPVVIASGIPLGLLISKCRERALKKKALVIKSLERIGAKFSMQVEEVFRATFTTGALGMVVGGRVEQGTIRNGDDVEIRGRGRRKKAKVFEVDTLEGSGTQGERVRLLIEDVTKNDVKLGDIVEGV